MLIEHSHGGFKVIKVMDLDNDTDADLIVGGGGYLVWHENDGQLQFTEHIIIEDFDDTNSAEAVDMDGDGDMDIVASAFGYYYQYLGDVSWFENDGAQNFMKRTIDSDIQGANSVLVEDFDRDGDLDVAAGAWLHREIVLYENTGNQVFVKHVFTDGFEYPYALDSVDMDGDGDMDILGATDDFRGSSESNELAWYENNGTFDFPKHLIEMNMMESVVSKREIWMVMAIWISPVRVLIPA